MVFCERLMASGLVVMIVGFFVAAMTLALAAIIAFFVGLVMLCVGCVIGPSHR